MVVIDGQKTRDNLRSTGIANQLRSGRSGVCPSVCGFSYPSRHYIAVTPTHDQTLQQAKVPDVPDKQ